MYKRMVSLLLTLTMILGLAAPALAAGETNAVRIEEDGRIKVSDSESYFFGVDASGDFVSEYYENDILVKRSVYGKLNNDAVKITTAVDDVTAEKIINTGEYIEKSSASQVSPRAYDYTGTVVYNPYVESGTTYNRIVQVYYTYSNGDQTSYTINAEVGDAIDEIIGVAIMQLVDWVEEKTRDEFYSNIAAWILEKVKKWVSKNIVQKNFTETLSADNYYYQVRFVSHTGGTTKYAKGAKHVITASGSSMRGEVFFDGYMPYYDEYVAYLMYSDIWGVLSWTGIDHTSGDRF